MEPAAQPLTYGSMLTSLASLGERTRKHRKSSSKALDNVTHDMDQLLFTMKHHTMQSSSPSSRVAEAQAWMNKAVIEKTAGRDEDEAAAYLTAASLWIAIEAERKDVNMMTSGDALARGVMCCAMACNILLSLKPNVATSPLPIKLTKMLNGHLSRCWSICIKIAQVLADFSCYEMSADYFELAAIVVTIDSPPATSGVSALGQQAQGNSSFATAASGQQGVGDVVSNASITSKKIATHQTVLNSSFTPQKEFKDSLFRNIDTMSVASKPTLLRGADSPTFSIRSKATTSAALGGAGGVYRTDRAFSGVVYEDQAHSSNTAAKKSGSHGGHALILNGFLQNYIVAMSCCALTCALVQDYPRSISIVDELLLHLQGIERSRRPQLIPSWAVKSTRMPLVDDLMDERQNANDEAETSEHCMGEGPLLPVDVSVPLQDGEGTSDTPQGTTSGMGMKAVEPSIISCDESSSRTEASGPTTTTSLSTLMASRRRADDEARQMSNRFQGNNSVTQSALIGTESLPTCPLAPPPGGSLHAHSVFTAEEHFCYLLETEATYLQMRLLKFFILLIAKEPQLCAAGAREQILAISELAHMYRVHGRYSAAGSRSGLNGKKTSGTDQQQQQDRPATLGAARTALSVTGHETQVVPLSQQLLSRLGSGSPTRKGGAVPQDTAEELFSVAGSPLQRSAAIDNPSSPSFAVNAVREEKAKEITLDYSALLFHLAAVLESILEIAERYPSVRKSAVLEERILAEAVEEAQALSKQLGVCSRNIVTVMRRAVKTIVFFKA